MKVVKVDQNGKVHFRNVRRGWPLEPGEREIKNLPKLAHGEEVYRDKGRYKKRAKIKPTFTLKERMLRRFNCTEEELKACLQEILT